MEEMKGKIVQVSGPVIDVEFEGSYLPAIKDALYVIQDGKKKVMEVSQHTGNNVVRCIMLAASEGLCKDMEVIATGRTHFLSLLFLLYRIMLMHLCHQLKLVCLLYAAVYQHFSQVHITQHVLQEI